MGARGGARSRSSGCFLGRNAWKFPEQKVKAKQIEMSSSEVANICYTTPLNYMNISARQSKRYTVGSRGSSEQNANIMAALLLGSLVRILLHLVYSFKGPKPSARTNAAH